MEITMMEDDGFTLEDEPVYRLVNRTILDGRTQSRSGKLTLVLTLGANGRDLFVICVEDSDLSWPVGKIEDKDVGYSEEDLRW
jgi:hypothetical protein